MEDHPGSGSAPFSLTAPRLQHTVSASADDFFQPHSGSCFDLFGEYANYEGQIDAKQQFDYDQT
ncbi:MAG: hypothetical protein HGJ93_07210 [Desulfosarcina sp.]|nr:hypothetical protein [Desulfosarcina sp.]MBC2765734.1 hypothetical protein [Desulfosarcina sp.]